MQYTTQSNFHGPWPRAMTYVPVVDATISQSTSPGMLPMNNGGYMGQIMHGHSGIGPFAVSDLGTQIPAIYFPPLNRVWGEGHTFPSQGHFEFAPPKSQVMSPPYPTQGDREARSNLPAIGHLECVCGKTFQHQNQLEACKNTHFEARPYICLNACGRENCSAKFVSKANLQRHCLPDDRRNRPCENCGKNILRQNLARHRKLCGV